MKSTRTALAFGSALTLIGIPLHAQPSAAEPPPAQRAEVSLVAGLLQPILLRGGNVEVDLVVRRFVVGYSHGFALNLKGSAVVGDAKDQGLAFKLPFSTGLGVGFRLTEWLDVRAEFKWHRFKVRYDDEALASGGILFSYDTLTIGPAIYSHWRPFRARGDWSRGLTAATSVRFWPNVHSTLKGDKRSYDSEVSGREEIHEAANIGIANTPWIVNVSVGYAFEL